MELELMKECPDCGSKDIQVGDLEKAPGGGFYQVCPNCGSKFYFDDHDDERDRQEDRERESYREDEDFHIEEEEDGPGFIMVYKGKRVGPQRDDY